MTNSETPVSIAASNNVPSRSLPLTPAHATSPSSIMDTSAPLISTNSEVLDLSIKKDVKAKEEPVHSVPAAKPLKLFQNIQQVSSPAVAPKCTPIPPFMFSTDPPRLESLSPESRMHPEMK